MSADPCLKISDESEELNALSNRLWEAADELRANSKLRSAQYSTPVLGILFLRYADYMFGEAEQKLKKVYTERQRPIRKLDYQREGVIYLTKEARYKYLLDLPEGANIGKAIARASFRPKKRFDIGKNRFKFCNNIIFHGSLQ